MTTTIYQDILLAKKEKRKLLAILLDPDKIDLNTVPALIQKVISSPATHVFIGGSHVTHNIIDELILKIKSICELPIVLFPGNPSQISIHADGILFLSLLSGRNPDFLIEHQVKAAPILKKTDLEIIPTSYILIESGNETAVARVSKTTPLSRIDVESVCNTAMAGEMLGHQLIYLEGGSGAKQSVPLEMIREVAKNITIPLVVGGGITSLLGIQNAYEAGADLVVIGTAFEKNPSFFENKYTQ
ncbi:geranylgeranylglyceryl/heptaprenylglyceryl phosphate synthase [Flavobacterium sp.]|jgi:putative glycerol-1-phosphate prenyltransferase|uniref:geranylgeranylglyceryl/heptaprenylglyceryl phosphate synthase n=1 Tax=Flavobacterium sp. TaxID=239 RepID=UPI0022C645BC|nr:geranylgeranylglyceryl/heptaprenylglyceryl phosphate synthase [Flavobacterium sp.]MCZ8230116.1 geranylgeranylglyceryl/heptaprenylglyceryl phosphate synthase [Flavobacterium sp.]